MSGAADDDSAPSNSTPQSPEGAESTPDVTVTETKPDTPGSHVEDDATSRTEANETPIDQPSESAETMKEENAEPAQEENVKPVKEDVEPAKEENIEPAQEGNTEPAKDENVSHNDVGKVDMAEGTADAQGPKPGDEEHPQSVSEESPVAAEEKISEPAPETGETEPVKQEDADPSGESKEAPPSESENGETSESKQPEEPLKEAGETQDTAVADESAKEEEKTEGVTVENTNAETAVTENSATENVNSNDNNDAAEVTAQNPEVEVPTDSDMQETKSNKNDTDQQIQDPVADASNTNSAANEDEPAVNIDDRQGESVEDIPTSNNPDSGTPIINTSDGGNSSKPEEAAENTKVELSELDSLKLDNERLGKKVKELEDEIDRIREGRKEGMKVHATYLARELSQQQDNEKYLKEKLAEVLQEKEESERRVKDLQLRLKRFAKDDQAKDARLAKMESELRDITQEVQILENLLDEDTLRSVQDQRASGKVNGPSGAGTMKNKAQPPPPQSKTCIIL